jgi:hypothetical protein
LEASVKEKRNILVLLESSTVTRSNERNIYVLGPIVNVNRITIHAFAVCVYIAVMPLSSTPTHVPSVLYKAKVGINKSTSLVARFQTIFRDAW